MNASTQRQALSTGGELPAPVGHARDLSFALLLALLVGGCTSGGGGRNPNLLAPKVVVDPRPDGNVTLFVHGAFRDQVYDWVSLSVDNATRANRTGAYSLEERVPAPGFFLDVQAAVGAQSYEARGRVDVLPSGDRVRVALLDKNGWGDPKSYGAPYELVLDHPSPGAAS
jgi:hypothetical protein